MAIVIRDGDIINIADQNVLANNRIRQVLFQEKTITIGDKNINTDRSADGLWTDTQLTNTAFKQAFYGSGNRIEIFQTTGSFSLDKTKFPALRADNIQWTMSVDYVQYDPQRNYIEDKEFKNANKSCLHGYFHGMPKIEENSFTQQGYWGENGVVTLSNTKLGGKVIYDDRKFSSVTVEETETNYIVKYCITTGIREASAGGYRSFYVGDTGKYTMGFYDLVEADYMAHSLRFDLYVNDVTVGDEGNIAKFGEADTPFTISIDTNPLYQKKTTVGDISIAEFNAGKILNDWQEGKESVTIEVGVGEYYDEAGDLVISSKNNDLPMIFSVGQMVVLYVVTANEYEQDGITYVEMTERGLAEYKDGFAKRFIIYDIINSDDGLATQQLKLVESNIAKLVTVSSLDDITSVILTRVSSPTANAPLGVIDIADGVIYLDDEIQIDIVRQDGYERGYSSDATLNNQEITSGSKYKVNGDWDIVASSSILDQFVLTFTPTSISVTTLNNTVKLLSGDTVYEGETLRVYYKGNYTSATITNGNATQTYSNTFGSNEFTQNVVVSGDINIAMVVPTWKTLIKDQTIALETSYGGMANNDQQVAGLLKGNGHTIEIVGSFEWYNGSEWVTSDFDVQNSNSEEAPTIGFGVVGMELRMHQYDDPVYRDDYDAYIEISIPVEGTLRLANHGTSSVYINTAKLDYLDQLQ